MSGFVKLTQKQIENKIEFIKDYTHAENPASGSKLDANANVTVKNLTSLACELNKDINIQVNRKILYNKISKLFDTDLADEYIRQLEEHEIYAHDETSLAPYTYGAKNKIVIRYHGVSKMCTFEQLYNEVFAEETAVLLDEQNGVWGKYPKGLEIEDRHGVFVNVSRLIKKVRHRDLVEVKTESGKSILVTDNHPMIVSEDKEATVEACRCGVCSQYDDYLNEWSAVVSVEKANEETLRENEYIYDITTESHSFVCNGLWVHNCTAISMYPFITDGMKSLGGESAAPKHLHSFCGSFVNLIYAISCQFAGACLHGSQKILVTENGKTKSISMKELVSRFKLDHSFESDGSEWEYADVSGIGLFVAEDGKNVAINKVYRRKYDGDIYNITTKTGLSVKCSKDHKFKHLFRGRMFETKAENLAVGDTVFANKDYSYLVDKNSLDYITGQVVGILCGDGNIGDEEVRVSVNNDQQFIMDFLDEAVEKIGLTNKKTRTLDKRGSTCWSYYIGSTNVSKKIKSMLLPGNTDTYSKNVDVSDKSIDWQMGFLDGLLVTDGSYSKAHNISISLTNEGLIKTVQTILSNINKHKNITRIPSKRENRKDLFKIGIPLSLLKYLSLTLKKPTFGSLVTWESKGFHVAEQDELYYIGPNASKTVKSNVVATNKKHGREDFVKCDVITSIEKEENDDKYVYELETETHWYNAGGFITHNCATVEFLMYFDWFARKDYGDNYLKTNKKEITDLLQQVIYCLNQPAGARNYQSTFWNISLFDKNYFDSLFGNFYFPDFTQPNWKSLQKLQNFFMKWFNEERTKALLTFPVVTAAMLVNNDKPVDEQFARDRAQDLAEGNSFFIYESNSVDSLSSCCRLRNELSDNDFSYSLGAGGVKSGSINVITINFNRLIQNVSKSYMIEKEINKDMMLKEHMAELTDRIYKAIQVQVEKIQKYQVSYRSIMESYKAHRMLPVYDAGFIDLDKQFLTTGINGLVEGCEYLGFEISDNEKYKNFVSGALKVIYDTDKAGKTKFGYKFNTEYVPAENLGVKNAKFDRESGYEVPRDCYNSYFYKVEDETLNEIDKFRMHGGDMIKYLDGGSALHLNLKDYPDAEQYYKMMCIAAKEGCNYWTTNVAITVCESCGHIDKHTLDKCPSCGSTSISYATRIIGYLKKISSFSKGRQIEAAKRFYH